MHRIAYGTVSEFSVPISDFSRDSFFTPFYQSILKRKTKKNNNAFLTSLQRQETHLLKRLHSCPLWSHFQVTHLRPPRSVMAGNLLLEIIIQSLPSRPRRSLILYRRRAPFRGAFRPRHVRLGVCRRLLPTCTKCGAGGKANSRWRLTRWPSIHPRSGPCSIHGPR